MAYVKGYIKKNGTKVKGHNRKGTTTHHFGEMGSGMSMTESRRVLRNHGIVSHKSNSSYVGVMVKGNKKVAAKAAKILRRGY